MVKTSTGASAGASHGLLRHVSGFIHQVRSPIPSPTTALLLFFKSYQLLLGDLLHLGSWKARLLLNLAAVKTPSGASTRRQAMSCEEAAPNLSTLKSSSLVRSWRTATSVTYVMGAGLVWDGVRLYSEGAVGLSSSMASSLRRLQRRRPSNSRSKWPIISCPSTK